MDARIVIVPFFAALLAEIVRTQWAKYKERKASEPVELRLKSGTYLPHDPVRRIERTLDWLARLWLLYIVGLLATWLYTSLA